MCSVCLLQEVFGEEKVHFSSHFPGSESLPNTCNVSILGPRLRGEGLLHLLLTDPNPKLTISNLTPKPL